MFRKLTPLLTIATLLGAVSAPALAQTRSDHMVQLHRHVGVSPYAYDSVISSSYATQRVQGKRRSLGETPAVPWTQDPESPKL